MPVVAIAGEKGGTGKTLLAVNIAAELLERGRRVALVDCDPQGSALTWANVAANAGHAVPIATSTAGDVRSTLARAAAGADWTIADLPGRAGPTVASAALVADVLLLPCGPGATDAWALAGTIRGLAEVRAARPELVARVVLTRCGRTALEQRVREAVEGLGVPILRSRIGERAAVGAAAAEGRGVTSYAPSSTAAAELRALVDELQSLTRRKRAR